MTTTSGPITTFMLQTGGYMVDNRLRIRGLIVVPDFGSRTNVRAQQEPRLLEAVSTHNSYGWEIRARASATDAEFLVIDDDLVLSVVDENLRTSIQQEDTVAARELFGALWRDPAVLEYESITTQSGVDARRLVLVPSEQPLAQLLIELNKDPSKVYSLTPQGFEQLVAGILGELGFEVRVTPTTRDGGHDMLAKYRTPAGDVLYLVECKRYAPDRPVGVSVVRGLYGVIIDQHATAGMVVTSSRFTGGARGFAAKHQYEMGLRDYDDLQEWIRSLLEHRPA